MKLKALILLLLLTIGPASFAQMGKYRNDLAIGITAGARISTVSFKPHVEHDFLPGVEIGFSARYTCEKLFNMLCALQTELTYAQMGWKEPVYPDGYSYKRTISYIRLPIMANLAFGKEQKGFKGFLLVGPELGFAVGESSRLSGPYPTEGISMTTQTEQRELPLQSKFDYGITAGAGFEYSHPKVGHFTLDARYYFALSSVLGDSRKDTFQRSANQSISVKVTWFYDVIKTKNPQK